MSYAVLLVTGSGARTRVSVRSVSVNVPSTAAARTSALNISLLDDYDVARAQPKSGRAARNALRQPVVSKSDSPRDRRFTQHEDAVSAGVLGEAPCVRQSREEARVLIERVRSGVADLAEDRHGRRLELLHCHRHEGRIDEVIEA